VGPLNYDGNYLDTPLGRLSVSTGGGASYVPSDTKLEEQGALFAQDDPNLRLEFTAKQIAFNYITGNKPSLISFDSTAYNIQNRIYATFDFYSPTGFSGLI